MAKKNWSKIDFLSLENADWSRFRLYGISSCFMPVIIVLFSSASDIKANKTKENNLMS